MDNKDKKEKQDVPEVAEVKARLGHISAFRYQPIAAHTLISYCLIDIHKPQKYSGTFPLHHPGFVIFHIWFYVKTVLCFNFPHLFTLCKAI